MKKSVLILLGVAGLVAAGLYVRAKKQHSAHHASAPAPHAVPVSVLKLVPERIAQTVILPARISPRRQAEIRPQVDGIIAARLFEEGGDVEEGQALYQIDDAPYKAARTIAEANLKSAEASVRSLQTRSDRYQDLVKTHAISQQEYDDALAQLDQANAAIAVAQAQLDVAQLNLVYTRVNAPISGRIGRSVVTEGSLVTARQGQRLAVITQLDPVYVDMTQAGVRAARVRARLAEKTRTSVRIVPEQGVAMKQPHEGVLEFGDVTVDETTGSIGLRAVVSNPDHALLPGMFVHAEVDLGEIEAVLVPQRAAIRGPDGQLSVWVVNDRNEASPRAVTADGAYHDAWIIREGLVAGETIVMSGYQKIAPGATVVPEPWTASKGGAESAQGLGENARSVTHPGG